MNDIHTIPLVDVIPFSPSKASNVLVLDSLPTDADFVVTSLVREILQHYQYQYQQPQQQQHQSSLKSSSSPHRNPPSHQPQPDPPSDPDPVGRAGGSVYYISGTPTTPDHISTRLLSTKRGMLLLSNAAAAAASASVTKKKNTTTTKNNITTAASSSTDPHHHNDNNDKTSRSRLIVRCIPFELATTLLACDTIDPKAEDDTEAEDDILKEIYRDLKRWIKIQRHQKASSLSTSASVAGVGVGVSWIVLDDLDTISTLVGETSVYCFVGSLLSVLKKEHNQQENGNDNIGLIVRCNNDHQQRIYDSVRRQNNNGDGDDDDFDAGGSKGGGSGSGSGGGGVTSVDNNTSIPIYAGAGGSYHVQAAQISDWTTSTTTTTTRTTTTKSSAITSQMVVPSMDTIIDVMTLPSGFSRDAQGRIIISETPYGRGWTKKNSMTTTTATSRTTYKNSSMSSTSSSGGSSNKGVNASSSSSSSSSSIIVNYQVTDSGPRAIRLRTK